MAVFDVTAAYSVNENRLIYDITTAFTLTQAGVGYDVTQAGTISQVYPSVITVLDSCNFAAFGYGAENGAPQLGGGNSCSQTIPTTSGQKYFVHARLNAPAGTGLMTTGYFSMGNTSPAISWSGISYDWAGMCFNTSAITTVWSASAPLTFSGYYANWYCSPYQCDVINVQSLVMFGYTDVQILAICNAQCIGRSGSYDLNI